MLTTCFLYCFLMWDTTLTRALTKRIALDKGSTRVNLVPILAKISEGIKPPPFLLFFNLKTLPSNAKYFGLPTFSHRSKKNNFEEIKEKMWKKISGWKAKVLSQVGRTTYLVSSCQYSLLQYVHFPFPKSFCSFQNIMLKTFVGCSRRTRKWTLPLKLRIPSVLSRLLVHFSGLDKFAKHEHWLIIDEAMNFSVIMVVLEI